MLSEPFAGKRLRALAGGRDYVCGLDVDGLVTCAGSSSLGQLSAPTSPQVYLAAGPYHACALDSDGRASCWGAGKALDADAAAVPPLEERLRLLGRRTR
jgi:alpha-tubulin suppressor-like RCC1 family protein